MLAVANYLKLAAISNYTVTVVEEFILNSTELN